MDPSIGRLVWLPAPVGNFGKAELGRAFAVLAELEGATRAGAPEGASPSGPAIAAEPFLRFALPLASQLGRGAFREAVATAFRAGAFPWTCDPVAPILALELDAFLACGARPLRLALACQDALELRLGRALDADAALKAAFDDFFRTRID
jgi:hypothetical protein